MKISTAIGIVLCAVLVAGCGGKLFKKTDRSEYTPEQFYQEAKEHLEEKRYSKAIEVYQELESTYPYGPQTEQGQLEIIYAYYKKDEAQQALSAADRFIRLHPTHPNVAYAYYLKGLINFTANKTFLETITQGDSAPDRDPLSAQESYNAFQEVVNRFPESRYAVDAKQRMAFLHNSLAMHEIHVADYYMRREAYVAVVNRGKFVLNEYPRTAAVEHALGLMMLAYAEMGLSDLSDDSRRVLALNFPDSAYLSGSRPSIKEEFHIIPASLDLNPFN